MTIRDIGIMFGYKVDEQSERNVEGSIKSLKDMATKMLGGVAVVVAIKKAANFAAECVSIASEVEEMENKFDVVFGEMRDEVDQWAANFADAVGRNKNSIKTYLADQQNLLVGFGMSRQAGAELAEQMTTLALDLASFGNMDEATSVNAMTKAVMGSAESAKTLGAVLNESTRAQAMQTLGLKGTYDKLDQLTKMQVNYQAILEQSPDAIGDCQRSLGSYESTTRQFQAKLLELKQLVGQFFLPTFQKILSFGARGITRLRDFIQRISAFTDKLGGSERVLRILGIALAATFAAVNIANVGKMVKAVGDFASKIGAAHGKTVLLFAIFVLLALIVQDFIAFMNGEDSVIGTLLERAGVDCDQFREDVVKIWNTIKTVLSAIWQGIKNVAIPIFQGIWTFIKQAFEAIGKVIETVAPKFAEFIHQLANGEVDTEKWVRVGETIAKIAVAIVGVVAAVKTVIAVVRTVTAVVKGVGAAISFLTSPVGLVILAIAAVIAIVVLCIKHWDKIKAAFIAAWEAIKSAWGKVVDFFKNLWSGIVDAFQDPKSILGGYFRVAWAYIKAIWDTVTGYFRAIWETIKGIFSVVKAVFSGDFEGAWEAIKGIVNTWIGYFSGVWESIKSVFSAVTSWFGQIFSAAWEAIKSVFDPVADFFKGIWDTIVSLFTSIGTAVGDAISGAVKGAINAVLSGAIKIINGFISAINLAIGVINKIPGVSINKITPLDVPQLAEGGYVGPDSPRHVIIGDNKQEGEIVSPVSKMRQAVTDAITMLQVNTSIVRPETAARASNGSTGSRTVTQNVNINNEFNGDRAGQRKSSEAMNKASDDAVGQMARALAFAR